MMIYGYLSHHLSDIFVWLADVDLSWLSFWLSRCFTWLFIAPLGRSSCSGLGEKGGSAQKFFGRWSLKRHWIMGLLERTRVDDCCRPAKLGLHFCLAMFGVSVLSLWVLVVSDFSETFKQTPCSVSCKAQHLYLEDMQGKAHVMASKVGVLRLSIRSWVVNLTP